MDSAYIYSLGWTLIHSIWQLTGLAVIFYVTMVSLRDRRPGSRYRISLLFMAMSVSVTSLTFILMYRQFAGIPQPLDIRSVEFAQAVLATDFIEKDGFWQTATQFLQSNVTSLTYMYIIGVILLMIRMSFNFWSLKRLKHDAVSIDRKNFPFLDGLCDQMNIRQNVGFRSSMRVHMPMVIGTIQPVIIIPAAFLTNTSPALLKAVIAHELAHIQRHDFLINIIQTVVETLFFYHPAVWYFSYMARREREFCCDHRAVEAGCDRESLARALSEVGELHRNKSLSMALGGSTNDLLNRVKYLLGMKPVFRYVPDHSVWYYGSLMGIFLLFSIGKSQFFQGEEPDFFSPQVTDTIPEMKGTVGLEIAKNIDTIVEYEEAVNISDNQDSVEVRIRIDTSFVVIKSDTVPGLKTPVVVRADGKIKVIVDGDEVVVYDKHDMRQLRDSLARMRLHAQSLRPKFQNLDSVMFRFHANRDSLARSFSFSRHQLDSLHSNLSGLQSRLQSFHLNTPDSLPGFSFTIPEVPDFNIDSLWDRLAWTETFHFQVDSLLAPMKNGAFTFTNDSLFTYFYTPGFRGEKFEEIKARSKELQELSREIHEKQRELQELRKQEQQLYREQMKKQQK